MSSIQIFDVYAYLHTIKHIPSYSSSPRGYGSTTKYNFPVKGINFILEKITAELSLGNRIVLAFDCKAPSRPRIDGYKSNRSKAPDVIAQAEFLYKHLLSCNVSCYRDFGEADDYVYNICNQYVNEINPSFEDITINSADYDLCHNVSERGVVFKAINSNVLNVNAMNFETNLVATKSSKEPVMFNTISAAKVFCGDKSDNIKGFTSVEGKPGIKYYREFKRMLRDTTANVSGTAYRGREILDYFINNTFSLQKDIDTLNKRADTIFPKDLTNRYPNGFKLSDSDSVNLFRLADLCKATGCYFGLSNLNKLKAVPTSDEELDSLREELISLGEEYKSGKYMADRDMPMCDVSSFSEVINIKDF